jgi:Holliday junction resolvasome RuvABC ATP-dependent DNA helicase subunit
LDLFLPAILGGKNLNILFRAPSGYGKTSTGFLCLNVLNPNYDNSKYYIPNSDGEIYNLNLNKRFHFIDEIHMLKSPETIYPIMDAGEFTFFLATNESGSLKEPLRNRCIPIIFGKYTLEELKKIVNNFLIGYSFSDEFLEFIAKRVKGNPRIAKIICIRLDLIFKQYGIPRFINELESLMNNILYIKEDGITELDEIYLNFLKSAGGLAGLYTLTNGTHIDKDTIINEIEPHLIELRKINITSRGRLLLETENGNNI